MISFIYRFAIAFSVVTGAYFLYATLVVPQIDTNVTRKKIETQNPTQDNTDRYAGLITEIFPEDDWIRDRCKILDAKQSILFFKEAKQLEDGNWEVKPFTMFLNPDEALADSSEGGPREKPIILRTEEGAYIKFEDGTSPNSPSGKFAGARMPGKVIVIREESKPDAQDSFQFETRNIQVNNKQILAVNPVQFKYGVHYGSGHNLTINLSPHRKARKQDRRLPLVRNLKTVELAHLDEIVLLPEKEPSADSGPNVSSQAKPTDSLASRFDAPVRVTCTGPFRLDFGKSKMVLFDEVHVEQQHPEKPHDHLYCDRLEVMFKLSERENPPGGSKPEDLAQSKTRNNDSSKMELRTVTAYGSPARLLIDSKDAFVQANQVNYHIGRRIVHCKQNVVLRDGDHRFAAPEMEYKLTVNNQLGTGWATGPGQIVGYPDDPKKVFKATWQSEFNIQPHEGKKAISLHGNAQIVFQHEKHFHCQEIHFWIWEKRQRGPKPKWDFYPAQMLGLRDVSLQAPEFAGNVEEVRVFWPNPIGTIPSRTNERDRSTKKSKKTNGKLASHRKKGVKGNASNPVRRPEPKKPVTNRIIGHGRLATAHLTRKNDLQRFRIEGDPVNGQPTGQEKLVHIQSVDLTPQQQGKPATLNLDVKGADIQVDATNRKDAYKISVRGFPSVIEAEGVKFLAPTLTVDQSSNVAWSHEPGSVEVSPSIQSGSRPFGPEPKTTIQWNKTFEFDGEKLLFTDNIQFQGIDYLDSGEQVSFEGKTEQLAARTNRYVNFQKSLNRDKSKETNDQQPRSLSRPPLKILELALLNDASIKAVTRESVNEIKSIDEVFANEINLRNDTGDARALGPGTVRSIRRKKERKGESNNLVSGVSGGGSDKLSYMEIAFRGKIVGNVKNRRGKILENIRAVFGDARDWNVRYDPDATSIFGEEIYLNCDEMDFSQWTPARSNKPLMELAAVGNTELEGKKFRALASQLTYTEETEVVQLEGLQRTNARIWFRKNDKQPWQYGEATKFRYQKSTSEIVGSEGVKEMRFLQFEAPDKRRK